MLLLLLLCTAVVFGRLDHNFIFGASNRAANYSGCMPNHPEWCFGTAPTPEHLRRQYAKDEADFDTNDPIPTSYDARKVYPQCKSLINVVDQGSCGSCWAQSAAGMVADRLCTSGGANVMGSAGYELNCDKSCIAARSCNSGCQGGYLQNSLDWITKNGITTADCVKYVPRDGTCPKTCDNGAAIPKYKPVSYARLSSVDAIKRSISTGGSVQAAYTVYGDFEQYKGGVYKHKSGSVLGGHAIKLIGYGTEGSTPYWIAQNSWGPTWGESGYFRIVQGSNDCGIEQDVWEVTFPVAPPTPGPTPVPPTPGPTPVPPTPQPTPVPPTPPSPGTCTYLGKPGTVARVSRVPVCRFVQYPVCLVESQQQIVHHIIMCLAAARRSRQSQRDCYNVAQAFMCLDGFPRVMNDVPLPPCQSLCQRFVMQCGQYLSSTMPMPDCGTYPTSQCIAPSQQPSGEYDVDQSLL
ncbi:putative cathepsin B2 cysteine protease [Paratrimastix pyriformis]|uniref:Cathepsin B2 cysteine protease n=1 Tax=Paratrimastix pyriformis TaxID=342808 RepID=A0ABQ8UQQ5_9EUKA|nr:putative cathepsin B2 cysteine protease [Paratrimastix pyriformis]